MVGAGAIPSIAVRYFSRKQLPPTRVRKQEENINTEAARDVSGRWCPTSCFTRNRRRGEGYTKLTKESESLVSVALRNKACWSKLLGTGVSWAFYDFVYYGTAFNQPEILATVLGESEGLFGVSWRDAMVAMMG